ncbi:MAG: hypothetical protein H6728_03675 [Myxococcales bacterium]|nr:hypothetical protein [Myxococcales bacterium]
MGKKKKKAKAAPSSKVSKQGEKLSREKKPPIEEAVHADKALASEALATKEVVSSSEKKEKKSPLESGKSLQVNAAVKAEVFSWFPGFPKKEAAPKRATFAFWAMSFVMIWVVMNAWICDDAFITFRSIDNWFHGYGLRWNVAERVQSYTHPLWMFLIAGVHRVWGDLYWATMFLSLAITMLTLWLLFRYAARSTVHIVLAVLVLSFSRSFIDFATSGLENPLAHLLLVIFLLAFFYWVREEYVQKQAALGLQDDPQPLVLSHRRVGILVALACLGMLNRMDHALLFAGPVLFALWHTPWNLRLLGTLALAGSPLVAWEAFSLIYYGVLVPNTAYAKLSTGLPWDEMIIQGLYYFFYTLKKDALTFVFLFGMLGVALLRSWRKERGAVLCVGLGALAYMLYIVRIGGDFMAGRFLSVLVVVLVFLMLRERLHLLAHALPMGILLILLQVYAHNPTTKNNKAWDGHQRNGGVSDERAFYFFGTGLPFARPGKSMPTHHWRDFGYKARLQKKRVVIEGSVGMFGMYAGPGVYIIDPLALSAPLLARLPMQRAIGRPWRPGHYIREIPPAYTRVVLGEAELKDPDLREYYEKIKLVTRGPLFSAKRWDAIWGFHTGRYRDLLRRYRERSYFLYSEQKMGKMRRAGEPIQSATFLRIPRDGAGVRLRSRAAQLYDGNYEIGVSRGRVYRVLYWKGGRKLGESRFHAPGRFEEGLYLYQGKIPASVLAESPDAIKIFSAQKGPAYLSHFIVWSKPVRVVERRVAKRRWAGTPWNDRGNIILGSSGGFRILEVQLSRMTRAPKVHLSADGNDDLLLSFFAGHKEVGQTVLHASPSNRGGLQVYAEKVPPSAIKAGYNLVKVRPLVGDGVFSVGHLVTLNR